MKNRSVMKNRLQDTPRANIPRSSFDRSHGYKTTFDAGLLIPFYVDEALPGDTFNLKVTSFARLATPLKPILDNIFMETFFFSVPVRQVWDNWEKFNGEQKNPSDSTDFIVPREQINNLQVGSVGDYMGLPTDTSSSYLANSLHFRAYRHIYNNWFRDQNLINSVAVATDDGPDTTQQTVLRRRKRPDYFTSSLPFPQKGDAVTIPIVGDAPVIVDPANLTQPTFKELSSGDQYGTMNQLGTTDNVWTNNVSDGAAIWDQTGLVADLANASGITINEMRESFQIQKLLERDARGGTRYPEIIQSHFGVTDPAMLVLQRPLYLGGSSTTINIQPVEQTQASDPATLTPQGNLAGYGTATMPAHGFVQSFTEHCVLIGIISVRADLTYQQGLNRMWSRATRFDYYWPALSGLGEQSVLNQEIFLQGNAAPEDEEVFGYQERYAEYRYKPSLITGQFRSTYSASLDVWHLSQEFGNLPVLGQTFIEDNPPIDRVIAVPGEPQFLLDSYFDLRCARPMPLFGIPGLIDHF